MHVAANAASSRDEEATGGLAAHFFLIPSRLFSFSVLLSSVTTDASGNLLGFAQFPLETRQGFTFFKNTQDLRLGGEGSLQKCLAIQTIISFAM